MSEFPLRACSDHKSATFPKALAFGACVYLVHEITLQDVRALLTWAKGQERARHPHAPSVKALPSNATLLTIVRTGALASKPRRGRPPKGGEADGDFGMQRNWELGGYSVSSMERRSNYDNTASTSPRRRRRVTSSRVPASSFLGCRPRWLRCVCSSRPSGACRLGIRQPRASTRRSSTSTTTRRRPSTCATSSHSLTRARPAASQPVSQGSWRRDGLAA